MDVDKTNTALRLPNGDARSDEVKTPFLIGVAGGTASGKSTVCKKIMEQLGQADMDHTQRQVVTISQDSFYRELTAAEKSKAQKGLFNFDHPDAFNEQLMFETLQAILKGMRVEIPSYDYRTNSLDYENKLNIYPADVVLFEGILVFYFPKIRDLFHMKLFVDTDSDTRLARRVPRDINERGRDLDAVLTQYMTFVKPAFEEFCSPTKKFADVIIPRGADNTVAIDLIVQHIRDFLNNRSHCGSSTNIALYMHNNDPSGSNGLLSVAGGNNDNCGGKPSAPYAGPLRLIVKPPTATATIPKTTINRTASTNKGAFLRPH